MLLILLFVIFLAGCDKVKAIEIIFDSNGGSEVASITKLEDFDVEKLPNPVKAGYIFDGWYFEDNYETLIQANNLPEVLKFTLYAKWVSGDVTYKVEHYQENANDNGYTLFETENLNAKTDTTVIATSKVYNGFIENQTHESRVSTTTVLGDGTSILKLYYQRNTYSLSFDTDGGSEITTQSFKYGEAILKPTDPTKEGYQFKYWYFDNQDLSYTFSNMPNEDILLHAKWEKQVYTVSFVTNNETSLENVQVIYHDILASPLALTRLGYEFGGWYTDTNYTSLYNFESLVSINFTLYAKWNPQNVSYKVEHYQENANDDGYTLFETENLTKLVDTEAIAIVKTYLEFVENTNHLSRKISGNVDGDGSLILKIYYQRNRYDLIFDSVGGSLVETINYKYGQTIEAPIAPIKTGHEFVSWYSGSDIYIFDTMPNHEVTLTAKWLRLTYTITFDCNAEISVTSISALYDDPIQKPLNPILSGYEFIDWYLEETFTTPYVFTIMPAENFTLYAKWQGLPAIIYYNSVGGSVVDSVTLPVGSVISAPTVTKEGYNLEEWYKEATYQTKFDFIMPVNGITVYAKWEPKDFTMTFHTNEGSSVAPITAKYLAKINIPANPTKAGYVFDGWYSDSELTIAYTIDTMPLNGITLYAKWIDENLQSQISNVLKQNIGSLVQVKGTVHAKLNSAYRGFYLSDSTGTIFIQADQNLVQIGDIITLEGYLEPTPMINGVSNLTVISSGNNVITPTNYSVSEIMNLEPTIYRFGKYVRTTGVVSFTDGHYYLLDVQSNTLLPIDHRTYHGDTDSLASYINSYVVMDLVLSNYDESWDVGFVRIEQVIESLADKMLALKTFVTTKYNNIVVRPGSILEFDSNSFNWGEITFTATGENASFYNAITKEFLVTDVRKTVTFNVAITVGNLTETVQISVEVVPIIPITISDFLLKDTFTPYTIQAIVVASYGYGMYIVKDETGALVIYNSNVDFEFASEVLITGTLNKEYGYGCMNGYFNTITIEAVISRDQNLNNPPMVLTNEQVLQEYNNLTLPYGTYVQVRGIIGMAGNEYYQDFYILIGGKKINLFHAGYDMNYLPYEQYVGMEVDLQGFIMPGYDWWCISCPLSRGEIRIVTGTDNESVNQVEHMFAQMYAGKVFKPYEKFDIPSIDKQTGCNITWSLSETSLPYFDMETKQFMFVESSVPIQINITVSKNTETIQFTYNTTLEPFDYANLETFYSLEMGEEAYLKGLIVYRNPNYAYLLIDGGLVWINVYDLDCYKGDYVILHGIKNTREYYFGEPSLTDNQNNDLEVLVKIISRDNPVVIPMETKTIKEINELDPLLSSSFTKYIEVSGYLIETNNQLQLTRGEEYIILEASDDYTYYKLKENLNQSITLRGYTSSFKDGNFVLTYTLLDGNVTPITYTELEKFLMIKEDLLALYASRYYDSTKTLNLKGWDQEFGATITYEAVGANASYVDVNTNTIYQVPSLLTVDFTVRVGLGQNAYTFDFSIPVYPLEENVVPITKSIYEVTQMSTGTVVTIEAKVMAVSNIDNHYLVLLKDESGNIYMHVPSSQSLTIGSVIKATAQLQEYRGRIEMSINNTITVLSYTTVEKDFFDISLSSIVSLDHRDKSIVGKPVNITGTIIYGDDYEYYLTDGYDMIRLSGDWSTLSYLYNRINYQVTLKGFIYGYDNYYNDDIFTVVIPDVYTYNSIVLSEITDLEIIDIVKETIFKEYNQKEFMPYQTFYLITSHQLFPTTISYQILSGNEYVTLEGNTLKLLLASSDQRIELSVTITSNQTSSTFNFDIYLNGFEVNSLGELFSDTIGVPEVVLRGQIILMGSGFYYFLIDGQIYYLEGAFGYGYYPGMEVFIIGRKTTIEGKSDLTYDIKLIPISEGNLITLTPTVYSLAIIYQSDPTVLTNQYLQVSGILKLDKELNLIYLEKDGQKLYLRVEYQEYTPSFASSSEYPVSYDLMQYLDHYVVINLLFPNKTIFGDVYLVDFIGGNNDIVLAEITEIEQIDISINKAIENYNMKTYYPGDDFQIWNQCQYLVTFEYTLNATEQNYINIVQNQVRSVLERREVLLNVTARHQGGTTKEFTITVIFEPLELSTVREALWGKDGNWYLIEGVVQDFVTDYWMLIKDDTGIAYVEIDNLPYLNVTCNIGDKVQILVKRDYYNNQDHVPMFTYVFDYKLISSNNAVVKNQEILTIDDILALDYLCPDTFNKYISFTGIVVSTGNIYYPAYGIYNEAKGETYTIELEGEPFDTFSSLVGSTITVNGYLMGFDYIYSPFSWRLIYDSYSIG